MRFRMLIVALALYASVIEAQDLMNPQPLPHHRLESVDAEIAERSRSAINRAVELSIVSTAVTDVLSTEYTLSRCATCYETNPLGQSAVKRVILKSAVTVGIVYLLRILERDKPKTAAAVGTGVSVFWGVASINNVRRAR